MESWKIAILSGLDAPPIENGKCTSQSLYEAMENSKKVLATLCIGLKNEDGSPLIDIDKSPWSQEVRGTLKPSNKELAMEVFRRQRLLAPLEDGLGSNKQFMIKPRNKPRELLFEWLNTWPIRDNDCVVFLRSEAHRVEVLLQAAIDEGRETALAMQHGAWSGPLPYLRLLHCLVDTDAIRVAFLKRNDVKQREELDATNSPVRPKDAYELIADKWNDPDFHPCTLISSCHYDFSSSIDLAHSKVAALTPADPVTVQNRLSSIRVTLLRIIDRWEQSGQGDGGRAPDNEDSDRPTGWGALEGRTQEALDNRVNFLGPAASWYLYYWELADKYQLLASTLQRLSENVGAASGNASTSVSRSRRQGDKVGMDIEVGSTVDSLNASPSSLHNVIRQLIESGTENRRQERELHDEEQLQAKELYVKRRLDEVNDTIDGYRIQHAMTEKSVFVDLIAKKEEELNVLQKELSEIERLKRSRID